MKIFSCVFLILIACDLSFSQASVRYFELTSEARRFMEKKEYKKSGMSYSNAFKSNRGKATEADRYAAARSWALAGLKDSAFSELMKVAVLYEYVDYNQVAKDSAFSSLQSDQRWNFLVMVIQKNIGQSVMYMNKGLVFLLDSIYRVDQESRLKAVSVKNASGAGSPEYTAVLKQMRFSDSCNLNVVIGIIEKYGWLGKDVVSSVGSSTLFMVMQHADPATQEKYLPMMKNVLHNGNVDPFDYALLADRLALRQGRKQIYGTVLIAPDGKKYYISEMEEPENIDKTRASIGLNKMDEYLSNWNMNWDINTYKRELALLKKENIQYTDLFFEK